MRICALFLFTVILVGSVQGQNVRTFVVGTDATLLCSWSSLEDPNLIKVVKWSHKGKRLRSNPRYVYESEGLNYTLTIRDVKKSDKGIYVCSPKATVEMAIGEASFNIIVENAALPDAPQSSELTLTEYQNGQINCNYAVAKEAYGLELYWTRDGERFVSEDRIIEDSDTTYTMHTDEAGRDFVTLLNVDEAAAGRYDCNYQYPDGQVFSMSFIIHVKELEGPQDVIRHVTFREDYYSGSVSCDLTGLANTTINRFYWEVNGTVISEDDEKYVISEQGHTRRLEVTNVNVHDKGIYRCVAELQYYPIAVRFHVNVHKSRKTTDFTEWTEFSVCDNEGKKYRFRTCTDSACLTRYGYVYEVDSEMC